MFEFTLKSFIFAVVNFLILVVVLYRFLHKPLLRVLEARRKRIEDAQKDAETKTAEAAQAREQYERKLADIDEERDKALSEARRSAEAARDEILEKARHAAEQETANLKRDWERQQRDALDSLREDIVAVSLDLARAALRKLTDSDVESKLLAGLYGQLDELASKADPRTRGDLFEGGAPVRVVSAKPLGPDEQQQIKQRIEPLSDGAVTFDFDTDQDLIAGVRIEFSSMAIDASLADVLAATRERFASLGAGQTDEEHHEDHEAHEEGS